MSNDVSNDVFLRCVSLSGTMQSAISVPLEKAAWTAIFSMAKSFSAERTILVVKMLTNTWDLRHM